MAAETDNTQEKQPHFTYQGEEHELPELGAGVFNMGEWMILSKYAGVTISDLSPCDDPAEERVRVEKLSRTETWFALFFIALARSNPKRTASAIESMVEKIDFAATLVEIAEQLPNEDEAENPTSVSEPETSSLKNSDLSSERLSLASSLNSETLDAPSVLTGTSG